jgi:transcriptional regulator NrdR family protein
MNCPFCAGETLTIDTRLCVAGRFRRRECGQCSRRFNSVERLALPGDVVREKRVRKPPAQKVVLAEPAPGGLLERLTLAGKI